MATGIIAIGASQQDLDWMAEILFVVAVATHVVLGLLLLARVVRYPRALVTDLTSHVRGVDRHLRRAGARQRRPAARPVRDHRQTRPP